MSTKPKSFDCIRMKDEIQRRLMAEQAGMTLAERQRDMETRILADPILGPWFLRLGAASTPGLTLAEEPPPYRAGGDKPPNETGGEG